MRNSHTRVNAKQTDAGIIVYMCTYIFSICRPFKLSHAWESRMPIRRK